MGPLLPFCLVFQQNSDICSETTFVFTDQISLKKLPFFLYNLAQISNLSNGLNYHITQVLAGFFTDLPKTCQNNNP